MPGWNKHGAQWDLALWQDPATHEPFRLATNERAAACFGGGVPDPTIHADAGGTGDPWPAPAAGDDAQGVDWNAARYAWGTGMTWLQYFIMYPSVGRPWAGTGGWPYWIRSHNDDGTKRHPSFYDRIDQPEIWTPATLLRNVHSDLADKDYLLAATDPPANWLNPADAAYSVRAPAPGDIIGPWLLTDMQEAFNRLVWICWIGTWIDTATEPKVQVAFPISGRGLAKRIYFFYASTGYHLFSTVDDPGGNATVNSDVFAGYTGAEIPFAIVCYDVQGGFDYYQNQQWAAAGWIDPAMIGAV